VPDTAVLVEDDRPLRELMARMLAFQNYTVLQAGNGQEALRCLDGVEAVLVVSDLVMPVMDGYQLLETLRQRRPLPVVAMTATLSLSDEQEKRLGGAPLLYKPFTLESFVAAIKAARFARPDFTYHIDHDKQIVVMRSTARPSAEERIAMVNRIWADPAYRRGYAIVIDRRGYEHIPSERDLDVFMRYIAALEARAMHHPRWAVVADRPSAWRFYQGIEEDASRKGVHLRAFQDYDLAEQWAADATEEAT